MSTYIGWRGIEPDDVEAKDIIIKLLKKGRTTQQDDEHLRDLLRHCPQYVIDDLLDMGELVNRIAEELVYLACSNAEDARAIIEDHREYRKRKEESKCSTK